MNKSIIYITISLCSINLTSCMQLDDRSDGVYSGYTTSYYNESQLYAQGNYRNLQYRYYDNYRQSQPQQQQSVTVPETYHVGAYHSPASFKDRDRDWVASQNPRNYTIEIADGDKAAQVAQKLYKAPKTDRTGQVQYERNGKSYYKGVYGSYDSPEAAQKALDSLPPELKQSAGVKTWGSVQGNVSN